MLDELQGDNATLSNQEGGGEGDKADCQGQQVIIRSSRLLILISVIDELCYVDVEEEV